MKKLLLLAVGICLLGATPLLAADLPYKAPPPPPIFNWTGFYVGINGGWANYRAYPGGAAPCGGGTCVQPGDDGWTLGGHIGFNWQGAGPLVAGLEADVNWLDLAASAPCANPAFTCSTNQDWMGSIRGRLGVAVDRVLFYITGGVAFTEFQGSTAIGGVVFPGSSSRSGWIFGGGFDWALNPMWILGFEYLYADFGTKSHTYDIVYPNIPLITQQARVRLSYRFGAPY